MAVFALDTDTVNAFSSQSVTLDGAVYGLRFQYNQREDCYYMSIYDVTLGTDILSSVKLVSNSLLVQRYNGGVIEGLPPGDFMALSSASDDSDAGLGELGLTRRVTLYYLDQTYLTTGA